MGPGLLPERRRDRDRARHPPGAAGHAGRRRHRARRSIEPAAPQGEAGLLGRGRLARLRAATGLVYFYVSTAADNRVVRAELDGDRLGATELILTGIPNGFIHDGGRLEFGPDGFLYVSTGETGDAVARAGPRLARRQDPADHPRRRAGAGQPVRLAVWTWGHRNVQGLAFDDDGRLWASEFGQDTFDELNLIEPAPTTAGPRSRARGGDDRRYVDPQLTWRPTRPRRPASPSPTAHLWMAALRGERLWRVEVDGDGGAEPEGASSSATTAGCAPSASPPTAGCG